MDNALAIVDSNDPTYNRLAMIRRLDRPVEYRMGPVYDDQHTPAESTVSTYESIDVSSPWLDIESLKRMFNLLHLSLLLLSCHTTFSLVIFFSHFLLL